MPFEVQHLHNVLGYGRRTALGPKDTVKQVHDRNVNGVKVKCVLISHQENHNREVCLDASTGALVRSNPVSRQRTYDCRGKVISSFSELRRERQVAR